MRIGRTVRQAKPGAMNRQISRPREAMLRVATEQRSGPKALIRAGRTVVVVESAVYAVRGEESMRVSKAMVTISSVDPNRS